MGDITSRIQLPVLKAAELLREHLGRASLKIEIAGALRRRRRDATCVDLLAIPKIFPAAIPGDPDLNLLWNMLDFSVDQPWHGGFVKRGDVLRSFLYRQPEGGAEIPVNVYAATDGTWGIRLINHTGPSQFWAYLHSKLQQAGYVSNNGTVISCRTGEPVETKTEHDVFALAQIQFREPWARDAGVVQRGGW